MERLAVGLVASLTLFACTPRDNRATEDETARRNRWVRDIAYREDAGQSWELSTRDTVRIGDGWLPLEHLKRGDSRTVSWRWMANRATIQLDTGDRSPHHLHVGGGLPPTATSATITYRLDGEVLAVHVVDKGWLLDIVIPSSKMTRKWMDLTIESSITVVPPEDFRELGASLTTLLWDPVAP